MKLLEVELENLEEGNLNVSKLRLGKRSLSHFDLPVTLANSVKGASRQERRRQEFKLKKKYRKILNVKTRPI